jgi:hypothetical protein
VEVASFLLNEKRPEIAKIELKQRINVLLVPNKSLETPHYKLERLKHDDPRLDNIEASYTMAEVVEDPTTVTRRSQEPTNRQTPVIKGVLPDAPAPASLPKAESTKPAPTKTSQAAAKTESSGGFFAWLKGLFGGTTETKEEPAKNVGKRGERTAKDGERADRGDRNGDRRGGRGGRGGRRGERNDRGERTEGATERNENTETRAPRENGGNRRGAERSAMVNVASGLSAVNAVKMPTPMATMLLTLKMSMLKSLIQARLTRAMKLAQKELLAVKADANAAKAAENVAIAVVSVATTTMLGQITPLKTQRISGLPKLS